MFLYKKKYRNKSWLLFFCKKVYFPNSILNLGVKFYFLILPYIFSI
jgi:hypothetical protein